MYKIDTLFILYFLVHIPITVLIDSQLFLPSQWFPLALKQMLHQYAVDYGDVVVMEPQLLWMRAFVGCEIFYQLPLMIVILYGLWNRKKIETLYFLMKWSFNGIYFQGVDGQRCRVFFIRYTS